MPFRFERLEIPEVVLVEPRAFDDPRGFFIETYKRSQFEANGIPDMFVQDNHSHSVRGVLRGLHFQKPPKAQAKLLMAVRGEVYDVAVDIRRGSPTYARWVGAFLSSRNHRMLYVPVGFAHGFCVVSEEADVIYKVSEEYNPELERGIRWDDAALGIDWPVKDPILSAADRKLCGLGDMESPFIYGQGLTS